MKRISLFVGVIVALITAVAAVVAMDDRVAKKDVVEREFLRVKNTFDGVQRSIEITNDRLQKKIEADQRRQLYNELALAASKIWELENRYSDNPPQVVIELIKELELRVKLLKFEINNNLK